MKVLSRRIARVPLLGLSLLACLPYLAVAGTSSYQPERPPPQANDSNTFSVSTQFPLMTCWQEVPKTGQVEFKNNGPGSIQVQEGTAIGTITTDIPPGNTTHIKVIKGTSVKIMLDSGQSASGTYGYDDESEVPIPDPNEVPPVPVGLAPPPPPPLP